MSLGYTPSRALELWVSWVSSYDLLRWVARLPLRGSWSLWADLLTRPPEQQAFLWLDNCRKGSQRCKAKERASLPLLA